MSRGGQGHAKEKEMKRLNETKKERQYATRFSPPTNVPPLTLTTRDCSLVMRVIVFDIFLLVY